MGQTLRFFSHDQAQTRLSITNITTATSTTTPEKQAGALLITDTVALEWPIPHRSIEHGGNRATTDEQRAQSHLDTSDGHGRNDGSRKTLVSMGYIKLLYVPTLCRRANHRRLSNCLKHSWYQREKIHNTRIDTVLLPLLQSKCGYH